MKHFIAFSQKSLPSARILKEAFTEISKDTFILSNRRREKGVVLSYGNSDVVNCTANSPVFIRACSDKLLFSEIMAKYGIRSPVYHKGDPITFPCIIRTILRGSGGVGIHVAKNKEEYDLLRVSEHLGYFWWTPFVFVNREFRIHVVNGEIIKVFSKVFEGEEEDEFPIRNLHRGYHFSLVNSSSWDKLVGFINEIETAFKSENIIPVFYALDCGYIKGSGWFVFEANTAPGLNIETARLYARKLADSLNLIEKSRNEILRTTENT